MRVSCDCMWVPMFIQNPQGSLVPVVREHDLYMQKGYLARCPRTCLNKYLPLIVNHIFHVVVSNNSISPIEFIYLAVDKKGLSQYKLR